VNCRRIKMAYIENGEKKPVEKNDGEPSIGSGPPWTDEGRAIEGSYLTPVESYETHTQAMSDAK
jgi:hypothetical protein